MKSGKLFALLMLISVTPLYANSGDSLMCTTGGFLYNDISYEETDDFFLISMSGEHLGAAEFDRFENIKIDGDGTVFVVFNKSDCITETIDGKKDIHCVAITEDSIIHPITFYVRRFFTQFDYSKVEVITRLYADKLEAFFSSAGALTITFTNAKFKQFKDDNVQTLRVNRATLCFDGPGQSLFPRRLKEYIERN